MQNEFCSLCFAPCDNFSEPIKENALESLAQLLPHINLNSRNNIQVACTNCSKKLRGYLEFKAGFLQAQSLAGGMPDNQEAYLQRKQKYGNENEVSIREDFLVCRFCLKQPTDPYITLVEKQKELTLVTVMMGNCFPGVELGSLSGCGICIPCHKALQASYNFVTSLNVENRIKKDIAVEAMEFEEGPDLKTVLFMLDRSESGNDCPNLIAVKEEGIYFTGNGDSDGEIKICKEELDEKFKVEIEAVQTDSSRSQDMYDEGRRDVKIKEEVLEVEEHSLNEFEDETCDIIDEQISNKRVKTSATQSETTYSCESCSYKTWRRCNLKHHELSHKSPSEVVMYKCDVCSYETKYRWSYNRHIRVHKSLSEVPTYHCEYCAYQSKWKRNFVEHMVVHKNPSEITMFACKLCPYKGKLRSNLTKHMLIHKNPSEVTMYKCENCTYETRRKRNLTSHKLVHKSPSELTMYKCELCPYQSRFKGTLRNHMLMHRDPSQVAMFKCERCPYQTKRKKNIGQHKLLHKGPEKVDKYKCDTCDYQTMSNGNLKRHILLHQVTGKVMV